MWSYLFSYFQIRSSATYDVLADTRQIMTILSAMPELKQTGKMSYESVVAGLGINLSLVKCLPTGNWHLFEDTWHEQFNQVAIHCTEKEDDRVPPRAIELLLAIAEIMRWELVEEENQDGEEGVILYAPT